MSRTADRVGSIALLVGSCLVALLAAELASRSFWSLRHGVSFWRPDTILEVWYPNLANVREDPDDGRLEILLLGGSVLLPAFGSVESELQEALRRAGHPDARISNLALHGHTSRDSAIKYAAMGGRRFDLVIVYHGINETRANNAPPDVFQDDYSHFEWYEIINAMAPYHGESRFALPPTLAYLGRRLFAASFPDRYMPRHKPRPEWVRFGAATRSAVPFRRNLEAILDLAAERGEPVLLATFAYHLPSDYSLQDFADGRLDYAKHRTPVELWGAPDHVRASLDAHNAVVRGLASRRENVSLVDQAQQIDRSAQNFDDVCHLTAAGSARFVENLVPLLERVLPPPEAPGAAPDPVREPSLDPDG